MSKETRPIIIVKKKKGGHGGHHGGAWKVAYADFVTAMMAFFMVMWIIGMDQAVKSAVEGYFQNPIGFSDGQASTANPISMGGAPKPASSIMPLQVVARQIEEQRFKEIGEKIELQLEGPEGLGELAAQVEIVMTDEGLRIELIEGGDGEMFFSVASSTMKPSAERALRIIAAELRASNAPIVLEGHTDAAGYASQNGFSNWELSSDRANAARRIMEQSGLARSRVAGVRGYADRHLRIPDDPYSNANRRISVFLPYTTVPAEVRESAATPPTAAAPSVEVGTAPAS